MSKKKDETPAEGEPPPEFVIRSGEGRLTSCSHCGDRVTSSGPTGYRDGEVVCDFCLVQGSHELGMVLAVVSVVRAYGNVAADSPEHHADALRELGAFARIYESFAAKHGPARIFHIPGFTNRMTDDPAD